MSTTTDTTTCQDCIHPACFHCENPVRSNHHSLADHPGTVSGSIPQALCQSCKRRGGPPTRPQTTVPDACLSCNTPFRPYATSITDHPGTLQNYSGGYCRTCTVRADRAEKYEAQREQKLFHLSDQELARIRAKAPDAYAYHMTRRPYREALGQKIGETA